MPGALEDGRLCITLETSVGAKGPERSITCSALRLGKDSCLRNEYICSTVVWGAFSSRHKYRAEL